MAKKIGVPVYRYYPEGYIGSEQAGTLLAEALHPENWRRETMPPEEREIWDGLGSRYNAEAIDYLLFCLKDEIRRNDPTSDTSGILERQLDFDYAIQDLRKALHSGRLTAYFCDEQGRRDNVQSNGWGTDIAFDILLSGIVTLEGGLTCPVLLRRTDIDEVANSLKAEAESKEAAEVRPSAVAPQTSVKTHSDQRSRRILFSIDKEARKVIFEEGIELKGTIYNLVAALSEQFLADRNAGVPRSQYGYVKAATLMKQWSIDDASLRRRVSRAREKVANELSAKLGHRPGFNDFIQNTSWKGYRLNPSLMLADSAELQIKQ